MFIILIYICFEALSEFLHPAPTIWLSEVTNRRWILHNQPVSRCFESSVNSPDFQTSLYPHGGCCQCCQDPAVTEVKARMMSLSSANAVSLLSVLYFILMFLIPVIGNIYVFYSPQLKHGYSTGNHSDIDNQDNWFENSKMWLLLLNVNQNISLIIGKSFLFLLLYFHLSILYLYCFSCSYKAS